MDDIRGTESDDIQKVEGTHTYLRRTQRRIDPSIIFLKTSLLTDSLGSRAQAKIKQKYSQKSKPTSRVCFVFNLTCQLFLVVFLILLCCVVCHHLAVLINTYDFSLLYYY
jgi:hypothetical protein